MKAMVLEKQNKPLVLKELPVPEPSDSQVLIKIEACGVCRTDLHIYEGDLKNPKLPLVLGHEIVGNVIKTGKSVKKFKVGDRIGVPWLGKTCGICKYCKNNRENLCVNPGFTGYTIDGGYAEYTVAEAEYCFHIPDNYISTEAAPLLCAGLIGYRSYKKAGDAKNLGIYGFGAAAHIVVQIAKSQGVNVFAFTRPGDTEGQKFAVEMGAVWAGDSNTPPPEVLDAAIIFAPVGMLVPEALKRVDKGGIVVCGGIHMSDIPSFPYEYIWHEREIKSVANLTKEDGEEFFKLIETVDIKTEVHTYSLEDANTALQDLKEGAFTGAAVLKIS
ncbi:MAG: alcohol dehydrogenase [Spirochaetes bacterium]|nr:MAG: alcohol dehydrogenase [Spirochaetota bacterium]